MSLSELMLKKQKVLARHVDDNVNRVKVLDDLNYQYEGFSFEVYTSSEFSSYISDIIDEELENDSILSTFDSEEELVDYVLDNFEYYTNGVLSEEFDNSGATYAIITSPEFYENN